MNMKKFSLFALVAAIVLCGFSSCEDSASMGGVATYTGKVINEYTDEPLADIDVKVTNGDKIHSMTKTISDGTFSIEVRLAEINDKYYILIGNNKVGTKQVEIPAFGTGEYNVGTITIKGPTETPVVETTLVRVDGKNLVFCEGKVVEIGEAAVTERGICYGTSTPTIKNSKISCGEGKGGFSCQIEDIPDVHAKNYYIRAYATNKYGTSYGETIMIDHRNPYNLYKLEDKGVIYLVLSYDLEANNMEGDIPHARKECNDLIAYDYDDWDLPSIAVLELMYKNKAEIGGFFDGSYWSSTEYSGKNYYESSGYYGISFSSGDIVGLGYYNINSVRPVRQY
jgi:hypothetical protein